MGDMNKMFDEAANKLEGVSNDDALAELVGDGKKYATPGDLAKAMLHGQAHISKLENENSGFRDTANQSKGIDDILAALKGQQTTEEQQSNSGDDDNHHEQNSSSESVQDLINAAFAERDAQTVEQGAEANRKAVIDKLVEVYGGKAGDVFKNVGQELGVDLSALAGKSPDAVLKLVTDARPAKDTSTGLPVGNAGSINTTQSGVLDRAAIAQLYKDGKIDRYKKIEMENEQLTILGDKFYN